MLRLTSLCPFLILHFVRCFVYTDAGPRYKQRIEIPFPRSLRNSFEVFTALRFLKKKIIFYEVEEIILAQSIWKYLSAFSPFVLSNILIFQAPICTSEGENFSWKICISLQMARALWGSFVHSSWSIHARKEYMGSNFEQVTVVIDLKWLPISLRGSIFHWVATIVQRVVVFNVRV